MTSRELNPAERMIDAFERANTLTFTIVAELRGALTHAEIEDGLRKLEQRHPLLRSQVVRDGNDIVLSRGEGVSIPLTIDNGDTARLHELARTSTGHRVWADAGPRAELTWLRFDESRSAFLLSLHHLVSDGSSGMIAMRDLLSFIATPDEAVETLDSPGLHAFLPAGHGGVVDHARALSLVSRAMLGPKPQRLRAINCPPEGRVPLFDAIALSDVDSARLVSRARRDGATVHGVLCAAMSIAVAAECGGVMQQRISHPVDLRRYLRSRYPTLRAIGDRVGYYVTSVDTDHRVNVGEPMSQLARTVTEAVRHKKAVGEPLLTAPVAGPLVTRLTRRMSPERFCVVAERDLMLSTYAVTNLGPLETLGLRPDVGALHVDDVWFVASGSVLSTLGGSATSFGQRLRFNLRASAPLIPTTTFERLAGRVRDELSRYVHDA